MTIAPGGNVTAVELAPATAPFASCVDKALRTAAFPISRAGATVSHAYAFASRRSACNKQLVDKTREEASAMGTQGLFAAALATLEPVVRCDASLAARAYLYACKAHQFSKAKKYFDQLRNPALVQLCIKEGFDPRTAVASHGTLIVTTKPTAEVFIDGSATGLQTPASLALPAGKHKVTLRVGPDKYSYTVTIQDGESTTLHKQLQ